MTLSGRWVVLRLQHEDSGNRAGSQAGICPLLGFHGVARGGLGSRLGFTSWQVTYPLSACSPL